MRQQQQTNKQENKILDKHLMYHPNSVNTNLNKANHRI